MNSTKARDRSSFTSMASWVEQLVRNKLDRADSNKKHNGAKSLLDGNPNDDNQAQGVTNEGPVSSTQDVEKVIFPHDLRLRMVCIAWTDEKVWE